jgi:NAD(P)-dependent dehydrogenase (short-subunit alcohol dehydrogenase family)
MKENAAEPPKTSGGLIAITGCDSGIGRSLAEVLAGRGYVAALSYVHEPPLGEGPGIYQKKMDMRAPEEVEAFCLFIKDLCQSGLTLQAVISNAGVALGGAD